MKQEITLERGQLKNLFNQEYMPPSCRIRASNDIEALERWLDEYYEKATTYRSYKKEGERFLVWCALVRKTSLRCLDRDDVDAYIAFLKDPQPQEIWCGPKGGRKKQGFIKPWYPFSRKLGQSALGTAIAILNSLMNYLMAANYVEVNPFLLIRKRPKVKDKLQSLNLSVQERILDNREWQAVLDTLYAMAEQSEEERRRKERTKLIFALLYFLGLRIEELAQSSWSNFRKINNRWWFFAHGKGDKIGKIPVNQQLLSAIMRFRNANKLSALPKQDEVRPLISMLDNNDKALSSRQISNLIKEIALKASLKFSDEPVVMNKLRRFSAHWLRHLSASRQDLAGISFTNIKENLRHQNEQTTRIYVHAYDEERHREMEKLTL